MRALHNQQKELTAELAAAKQAAEQVRLVVHVNFSVLELRVSFLYYENIVGIRIHAEIVLRGRSGLLSASCFYVLQPITQHNIASTHCLLSPVYVPLM